MIDVAIDAAKQAGMLALTYFQKQPKVTYKTDNSPVTIADKKAEQLIRKIVKHRYPDHGFLGEEYGKTNPKARFQWVVDPIDGTRDFTRQSRFWATLIAVLD